MKASNFPQVPESRFLSEAECGILAAKAANFSVGGGETGLQLETSWMGNIRFARNAIISSGDVRDHPYVRVVRSIRGAIGAVLTNQIEDLQLEASIRRCERILKFYRETGGPPFQEFFVNPAVPDLTKAEVSKAQFDVIEGDGMNIAIQAPEIHARPHIFHNTSYSLDAESRAEAIGPLVELSAKSGMLAAGYVEVSAYGRAVIDTWGRSYYYPYTKAQYSITVRDPEGVGSGWAGVDWGDWTKIDTIRLSEIAIDKCLRSRNPVAVEPGRYNTILEPQAVHQLMATVIRSNAFNRAHSESNQRNPWTGPEPGTTKIGLKVLDERITIESNPHDEELGFVPFGLGGEVFNPATWFKNGVLMDLPYSRSYAIQQLGINKGLPNSGAYRMSGGPTSIEEMIETVRRGIIVTRFSNIRMIDEPSIMLDGFTRDGLWLIENGKISKPIKNFRFVDSPLFAFNSLEQIGEPVRVFSPEVAAIVPPAKVREFNFTSLTDAI